MTGEATHDVAVRELVYLSHRKLEMFAAGQPRRWRDRAQAEGEIKIPGIGGFKLSPKASAPNTFPELDRVVAELEGSDRAPKWFTDDTIQPGQWIHFEAPLSYIKIRRAVIFLDPPSPRLDYPEGKERRLVLHGSAEHLVDNSLTPELDEEARRIGGAYGGSEFPAFSRMLGTLLDSLNREIDKYTGQATSIHPRHTDAAYELTHHLDRAIRTFDQHLHAEYSAAWMAGYARTTALFRNLAGKVAILATPLYVEHASPPVDI